MASLVRRGVLRNWTRFVRQGAVTNQALHVQRLKLHQNKAVRSLVTSSKLFAQESAPQLETSQDDPIEDESKSNIKNNIQLEHLDRQLYKLDMDVRRTGRTMPFDLKLIMEKITPDCPCTSNQALMILRCCGSLLSDEQASRRTARVESYWKTFQRLGVALDVSHYNALLKVHLENGHKIIPSDFLAHMEELGIAPNRVTFQHMIGLYCLDGNITGATTILEHMKSQDMAINDSVFHYLLQGHCYNDDQASVDSTLEIMSSSGLDLGPDAVRVMAVTHGKAGRWQKVDETLAKAEEADVKLNDGDVFEIIVALCQAGLEAEARIIKEKLPKKRGYFQELRSALPQIIFTGSVDLAMEIFFAFQVVPTKTNNENHDETERRDKGAFIVRSLIKAETDVDKLLKVLEQFKEGGYKDWLWLVVDASVQFGSPEYCEKIGAALAEQTDGQLMDRRQLIPFIRKQVNSLRAEGNPEKVLEVLQKIKALGLMVPKESVSNDVIPLIMDLEKQTPADVIHTIHEAVPSLNFVFLFNTMVQSLLNREKLDYFRACSGFLLNANIYSLFADMWHNSLARSYLITDSLDDLINVLFVASRPWNHPRNSREREDGAHFNEVLFRSLSHMLTQAHRYRPDEEKEDILRPVVQELIKHRIGIPKENVNVLKEMMDNTDLHQLLDEAAKQFEEDYWTKENFGTFMDERRKLFGAQKRGMSPGANFNNSGGRFNDIPDNLQDMEKMKSLLDGRGQINKTLNNNLVKSYAAAGNPEKSIELINATNDFHGSPMAIQDIVENLVNAGKVDQALDFYRNQREEKIEMFSNTLIAVCIGLAKDEKHAAVLDLLAEDNAGLINGQSLGNNIPLMEHYVEEGDIENLGNVFEAMGRVNLVNTRDSRVLGKLVQVHLVRGDMKAAVQEFERICTEYRRLAHKFSLMEKLLEEEDLEGMQKVLDLSIEVVGEEKSLYDLAHIFLQSGKKAQAKKLFETPGLRYNEYKMNYLCQQLGGNLEALEDLVMLSKSVFGCDRNFLYTQLVRAYADDPDKVSEIWINVQEEGVAPSDDLKLQIAKVLQKTGKSVPFEIPEEKLSKTNVDDIKSEKDKKVKDEKDKKVREESSRQQEPANLALRDSISKAAESGDAEGLLSILAANKSYSLHAFALRKVVENGHLEDACKVADAIKNTPRKEIRKSMHELFQKLKTANRPDLMTSLTDGFDERNEKFFLVNEWERENANGDKEPERDVNKVKEVSKGRQQELELEYLELKKSVSMAAKSGDIEGVLTILAANEEKYKLSVVALENIIEHGSLEEACKLASSIEKKSRRINDVRKILFQLFEKLNIANRLDLMTSLTDGFEEENKRRLGVNSWVISTKAHNNPEEYLDVIRTSPNFQSSLALPPHALVGAMEKNSELGKGLAALVNEGSEMATVLLAQVAVEKGDKEEFTKLWNQVTSGKEMSYGDVLQCGSLKNAEKLRWTTNVLKELNAPKDAFKIAYGQYFISRSYHGDTNKFDGLIKEVLDNGVELKDLNVAFVKFLSKSEKSAFKDAALKALPEEKPSD